MNLSVAMVASLLTSGYLVIYELPYCYPRGHKGQNNLFYVAWGCDFLNVHHILHHLAPKSLLLLPKHPASYSTLWRWPVPRLLTFLPTRISISSLIDSALKMQRSQLKVIEPRLPTLTG